MDSARPGLPYSLRGPLNSGRRGVLKTLEQVAEARKVLLQAILEHRFSNEQIACAEGMVVALCWVADSPNGSTLEDIIRGHRLAAKKHGSG